MKIMVIQPYTDFGKQYENYSKLEELRKNNTIHLFSVISYLYGQ